MQEARIRTSDGHLQREIRSQVELAVGHVTGKAPGLVVDELPHVERVDRTRGEPGGIRHPGQASLGWDTRTAWGETLGQPGVGH